MCLGLGEKKAQRFIHGSQEIQIGILKILNLDKYQASSSCRAGVEHTECRTASLSSIDVAVEL